MTCSRVTRRSRGPGGAPDHGRRHERPRVARGREPGPRRAERPASVARYGGDLLRGPALCRGTHPRKGGRHVLSLPQLHGCTPWKDAMGLSHWVRRSVGPDRRDVAGMGGHGVVRVGLLGRARAGRVQICCKGAPRPDRPREEPQNINDSPPALRCDGGLCNRFGQTAPPRAPGRSAAGRAALSWSVSARSRPARRGTRRHHRINSPGRRTTRTTTPTPHRNTPGVPARKTHHAPWERTITTSLPRKSEQTPAE